MKPPTRKQKRAIYKEAIEVLKLEYCEGMCAAIESAQCNIFEFRGIIWGVASIPNNSLKSNFPEIYEHKPYDKCVGVFWFPFDDDFRNEKRIQILKKALRKVR